LAGATSASGGIESGDGGRSKGRGASGLEIGKRRQTFSKNKPHNAVPPEALAKFGTSGRGKPLATSVWPDEKDDKRKQTLSKNKSLEVTPEALVHFVAEAPGTPLFGSGRNVSASELSSTPVAPYKQERDHVVVGSRLVLPKRDRVP
jgi:hypothetical protein